MCTVDSLRTLSDQELLDRLDGLAKAQRELTARIVAHLALVEERGLHLDLGYSSLFGYCVARLGFSEDAALRRIRAARLLASCPAVLSALESGKVSLTALGRLAPHLRSAPELLSVAEGKTVRELDVMLAERFPNSSQDDFGVLRPVAKDKYRFELVVGAALAQKLGRAQDLCRHRIPDGNLAEVLERAVDLLISQVEKERFAKVEKPRAQKPQLTRTVPAQVKREVYERDQGRCAFVASDGRRCPATAFLEFDHVKPRALGGQHSAANGRMLCRAHNQRAAELTLGPQTAARGTRRHELELALKSLGFAKNQVRRASAQALKKANDAGLEDLLRSALAMLRAT